MSTLGSWETGYDFRINIGGEGGPEFQKYHPEFQLGTFICIWDIRNGLRPLSANKNEYPPSALQFNYTKEI